MCLNPFRDFRLHKLRWSQISLAKSVPSELEALAPFAWWQLHVVSTPLQLVFWGFLAWIAILTCSLQVMAIKVWRTWDWRPWDKEALLLSGQLKEWSKESKESDRPPENENDENGIGADHTELDEAHGDAAPETQLGWHEFEWVRKSSMVRWSSRGSMATVKLRRKLRRKLKNESNADDSQMGSDHGLGNRSEPPWSSLTELDALDLAQVCSRSCLDDILCTVPKACRDFESTALQWTTWSLGLSQTYVVLLYYLRTVI